MQYAVVIEKSPRNYSAYLPDVPGCVASGKTVQQTIDRLREALAMHFRDMVERGEQLPDPETIVDHIDVALPAEVTASRPLARNAAGAV